MNYLLDTNAVIAVLNAPAGDVAKRLRRKKPASVSISAVVLHELYFGAFKSVRVSHNVATVDGLAFNVLAFDRDDARAAGEVRAALQALGTPIGPYDILIAGQALSRRLTLVTHNVGEFSRVAKLKVEDWQL